MPAAVAVPIAVAGIGAASSYIGGRQQANAAKRAQQAQQQSGREALDYQRSRDTVDDQRYQKKYDMYQQYLADYRARNGGAGGAPSGGGGGGASMGSPVSIADLVGSQQGAADATAGPAGSVADTVGGVFDWHRYGA